MVTVGTSSSFQSAEKWRNPCGGQSSGGDISWVPIPKPGYKLSEMDNNVIIDLKWSFWKNLL